MRLSRDIIIGFFCLAAAAAGFYLVQNPELLSSIESSDRLEVEVGDLSSQNVGVRYRLGGSLVWQDVPAGKKRVRVGDAIFTASSSRAELDYESGDKVEIEPNSLVVVNLPPSANPTHRRAARPVLSIQKGSVKVAFNGERKSILVEAHGKTFEVKPQERMPAAEPAAPQQASERPAPAPSSVPTPISPQEVTISLDESSNQPLQVATATGQPAVVVEEVHAPATDQAKDISQEPVEEPPLPVETIEPTPPSPTPPVIVAPSAPTPAPTFGPPIEEAPPQAKPTESPPEIKPEAAPSPTAPPTTAPVVAPENPPMKDEAVLAEESKSHESELLVAPDFGFTRISATDLATQSNALLTSQLETGISATYLKPFNGRISGYLQFRLGVISFGEPSGTNETLSTGSQLSITAKAGGVYSLTPDLSFDLSASYQTESFVRGETTSSLAVDEVMLPSFSGNLSYNFINSTDLKIGPSVNFGVILPGSTANYRVNTGTLAGASMFVVKDLGKKLSLRSELSYEKRSQDTTVTSQSQEDVGLSLGLTFRLGSE